MGIFAGLGVGKARGTLPLGKRAWTMMEMGESLVMEEDLEVGLLKARVSRKGRQEVRLERWWCQIQGGLGCRAKDAGLCP